MARKQSPEIESHTLVAPGGRIAIPDAFRKAEYAWITTEIIERNPLVGKLKYEYLLTREWTGYLYLLQNDYLVEKAKDIEYKNQIHYYDRFVWQAETVTQNYVNELTVPDADANEIIDETALSLLYAGEFFTAIANSIDIPIIGDILDLIVGTLSDVASDNLYYFPRPNRPDEVIVSVPNYQGTSIKLSFLWIPFSPISAAGGVVEVSIEDEVLPPELPAPTAPIVENTPPGKCPELPADEPFDPDADYLANKTPLKLWRLSITRIDNDAGTSTIINQTIYSGIQPYFRELKCFNQSGSPLIAAQFYVSAGKGSSQLNTASCGEHFNLAGGSNPSSVQRFFWLTAIATGATIHSKFSLSATVTEI